MRKKFTMLLAALFMTIGTVWAQTSDFTIGEANGTVTDSWENSSWTEVTGNIPEGVAAVEKGEYSDATSRIGSASKKISLPAGSLRATLMYVTGNHRLDILGVDLLKEDGTTVVSSDYHFGFSGNQKVNNAYDLEIPEAGVYTIRYWVTFCKEANTSSGNITLQHYKLGIPVYSAAELSNEKVYTVTPADNDKTGAWDVMADDSRLSITSFSGNAVNAASAKQQFAFLTVNGETYLYNYGTKKFVENDGGQKLTDNLSSKCLIEFLVSTITSNQVIYPLVVKVGGNQLHSSYQNHLSGQGGIITTWEHTNSPGNAVAIVPVDGTVDLSAAIAEIEAYQTVELKKALEAVLDEANTLAGKDYINSEALNTAIAGAQEVYDDATATYAQVAEKKDALSAAIIAAGYVTQVEQFSNNAVYTFLSKRSDKAYMMYDAETPYYVASQYMKTGLTVGSDVVNCQWAVYKSANGYYYMYNLGAGKFMGTESAGDTSIPFSETPQTTGLKFGVSTVSTHPIMISSNNGSGAINHSNQEFGGKNKAGVITWAGGFGFKGDPGNVHQVAIVGELNEETLATIKTAVEAYEARGIAKQELDEYLTYFNNSYYDASASTAYKWRDQEGVNNYTIGYDSELTLEEYYNNAKAVADNVESTAEELTEQLEILQGVDSWTEINQPEAGKFYRLRCVDGQKRLQSIVQADGDKKDRLTLANNTEATTIFLYDGNGLLSYTNGLHMDHRVFNTVGTSSAVIFSEAVNGNKGQYNILVGPNYIYGAGTTLDSGSAGENGLTDKRDGYNWWLEEVTTLPVTVGDRLHATFFAPVAVTIPEGIQAYTGKVNGEWLTLTEVEGTIPAGTAVVLIAQEAKTYEFTIVESEAAAVESQHLRGTTSTIVNDKKDAADKYYTLQSHGDNGVAFRPYIGANIGGFKAYLEIPAGTNAAALRIRFAGEEENTTGIEGIELGEELVIYDLAGRRVQKMEKGIYIVNGKKVVIK